MFTRSLWRASSSLLSMQQKSLRTLMIHRAFSTASINSSKRGNQNQTQNQTNTGVVATELNPDVRETQIVLRQDSVSLEIELQKKQRKIFFINEQFTFTALKQIIEFEDPSATAEFDFTRSGSQLISEESNLLKFLLSETPGEVILNIDDQQHVLRSLGSSTLHQLINQAKVDSLSKKGSLYWYQQCANNQINPSHAGVLSQLITQFQNELKILKSQDGGKKNIQLTDVEIDQLFINTFKTFSVPVAQDIDSLQHEKNIIEQELDRLYSKRDKLDEAATKRARLYLKLILLLSAGHILTFYYMIFQVDWLGWDIIEPITYSVSQITVLLGILFFLRHKKVRSVNSILDVAREKYFKKRVIKDIHINLMEQIAQKETQLNFIASKQKLLLNKKTYNTILLSDI